MIDTDKILLAELAALMAGGKEFSTDQTEQLKHLMDKYPEARGILLHIMESGEVIAPYDVRQINIDQAFAKFSRMAEEEKLGTVAYLPKKKKDPYRKLIGVAAALIVLIGIFWLWKLQIKSPDFIVEDKVYGQKNDVLPGKLFAQLSIDGGEDILLNNAPNNNQIAKNNLDRRLSEKGMHVLTVPSRATYELSLSDGSHVWISPGSRLEYEGGFSMKERRIKLTGEAYFKVAKDADRPFIVEANGMQIQAVGTEFNVRAYHDKPIVQLAEGRIKVSKSAETVFINAGNEVQLDNLALKTRALRYIEEATSWKEGKFSFDNKDLQQIMEEIGRWYGVDIQYQVEFAEKRYQGGIDRNVTLAQLCSLLNELTGYKFIIENEKLIVTS